MAWSDQRTVNLDAAAAAGFYQQPITLRAWNAPRPTIRTISVINQSPNVDVGVCIQLAKSLPDFVIGAQFMSVIPIVGTDTVVFTFSKPAGSRQTGQILVQVTDDALAASSSVAPSSGSTSAFVLDISQLDGSSRIQ